MKTTRSQNFAIFAVASLLALCSLPGFAADPVPNDRPAAEASTINNGPSAPKATWGSDFAQAKAQSAKLNRPILLHFHARWCAPCQQMEHGVLNAAHVLKAIDTHCVGVKIDTDRHPGLVQQYRVEVLPCDVFITPEGKVLHVSQGYIPANAYATLISQIARPKPVQPVEVTGN